MTRFVDPIVFVRDINVSTQFYNHIVGLTVAEEHENFIRFETGFAIHDATSLAKTVWGDEFDMNSSIGRGNLPALRSRRSRD